MKRSLTPDLFNNLLVRLDPSGESSGQRYEEFRRRLIKFFEWRGCTAADELADTTIDRVASLLGEGREITSKDSFSFFHGVAQNILREYFARERPVSLDQLPGWQQRLSVGRRFSVDVSNSEKMSGCLDRCAVYLSSSDRMLIIHYYTGEKSAKIAKRKELAQSVGISLNALRIRAYRIREALQSCVARCAGASKEGA